MTTRNNATAIYTLKHLGRQIRKPLFLLVLHYTWALELGHPNSFIEGERINQDTILYFYSQNPRLYGEDLPLLDIVLESR
jgi:hypothetical protein